MASKTGQPENPDDTWITEGMWDLLDAADRNVSVFEGITVDIDENMFSWKAYLTATEPQSEPLPGEWDDKLTNFQKMLLIKCTRPEKMLYVAMDFVKNEMGAYYIDPIAIDRVKIFPETN